MVEANPKSKPYVAYRTDPFDQEGVASRLVLGDGKEIRGKSRGGSKEEGASSSSSVVRKNRVSSRRSSSSTTTTRRFEEEEDPRCPLSFRLGSAHGARFGTGGSTTSTSDAGGGGGGSADASGKGAGGGGGGGGGTGAHSPPVIHPLHPDFDAGSGRQILLTTDYEVLEMWTPSGAVGARRSGNAGGSDGDGGGGSLGGAQEDGGGGGGGGIQSAEQMKEDEQFPLLFEGSSFYHASPVVHDVEGDGVADAILGDYDGDLHLVGLDFEAADLGERKGGGRHNRRRRRYYRRIPVPRLYVRKTWYDRAINRTSEGDATANNANNVDADANNATSAGGNNNGTRWEDFDPYHTYFAGTGDEGWKGERDEEALRGVSGDVLNMDADLARGLAERRRLQKVVPKEEAWKGEDGGEGEEEREDTNGDGGEEGVGEDGGGAPRRRLQEVVEDAPGDRIPDEGIVASDEDHDEARVGEEGVATNRFDDDYKFDEEPGLYDDAAGAPPDGTEGEGEEAGGTGWGDDFISDEERRRNMKWESEEEGDAGSSTDDAYGGADDAYRGMYDDYMGGRYGDDHYRPEAPDGWDSYDEYQTAQDEYFHDSNYLRLPPHLLSTCTVAELPRAYSGTSAKVEDRTDELILCAVSYFFDEDECRGFGPSNQKKGRSFGRHANADGGDETEERRGRYVANAVMGYNLRWKYWSVQEVLDLSTDWSAPLGDAAQGGTAGFHSDAHGGMGAWALATPIAVKLDGSDRNHIIIGTSMGLVYALEAQWHSNKGGWPVQMRHPVEQKVLAEDVVGNADLEVFVVDAGGDVASLDAGGGVLWARNLLRDDEAKEGDDGSVRVIRGTSPMSMGDVEGTGGLAVVLLARIATTDRQHVGRPDKQHEVLEYRLYAVDAVTGDDLPHFPISLDGGSNGARSSSASSMPQPLLVDLHEDQRHWLDQIRGGPSEDDVEAIRAINRQASGEYRAGDSSRPRPHGGSGRGLHVVQPIGSTLHIIEGSTSCEQKIDVGDPIPSMVQADDVHGTGGLDLVVTTSRGEILTLESDVVPYHPLNVWSAGVSRAPGSGNAAAHGFSSSQGIFVHPVSRQFRDVLGIYVPITFEVFDRRAPGVGDGSADDRKKVYEVEVRAGMSAKRTVFSHKYDAPGVYTERIQIPYGPGYYAFSVRLRTTQGIVYQDTFHLGWNVNYMGGLWLIVCLPLVLAAIPILLFKRKPNWEEDEDYGTRGSGILGRAPPP